MQAHAASLLYLAALTISCVVVAVPVPVPYLPVSYVNQSLLRGDLPPSELPRRSLTAQIRGLAIQAKDQRGNVTCIVVHPVLFTFVP